MSKVINYIGLVLLIFGALVAVGVTTPEKPVDDSDSFIQKAAFASIDNFGIDLTQYHVAEASVLRNETFSDILSSYDVPRARIAEIVEKIGDRFDVRHMRAGKPYRVYQRKEDGAAEYLVYQHNSIDYVVFGLTEAAAAWVESRPIKIEQRITEGFLTSSLYDALMDQRMDLVIAASLSSKLSEVFAWQLDFRQTYKDDKFRVAYDVLTVGGKPIGVGEIRAARFVHIHKDYYAFNFADAGRTAYFDENGESIRRTFLMSPVKTNRITSRYSPRRFHPVLKRYKAHLGTDYGASRGTPIHATGDGVVLEATRRGGNGRYVKIKHNGTYTTAYLHMSKIGDGIRPGVHVSQGDVIGYVGKTGLATAPHVCYRFWKNGKQVDHLRENLPVSDPVPVEERSEFDSYLGEYMPKLVFEHERTPSDNTLALLGP